MRRQILLIAACAAALAACTQVKPGYVGIKVNQYGSDAGVDKQSLGVGSYWVGFGSTIEEYPVFTKTYTYTRASNEQNGGNEEFTFQDKNGLGITADIGVSYSVNPGLAPVLYSKFRTDADGLVVGQLRNEIRDALNRESAQMGVEEIYGPRKAELLNRVQADVQKFFSPYGLNVEKLFLAGNVRPPDSVVAQINQKIANEQAALAAQQNVARATAEAESAVASARGRATAIQVEAEAIKTNPEIVQMRAIERWDGHLPTYASSGPLPFIGNAASK